MHRQRGREVDRGMDVWTLRLRDGWRNRGTDRWREVWMDGVRDGWKAGAWRDGLRD